MVVLLKVSGTPDCNLNKLPIQGGNASGVCKQKPAIFETSEALHEVGTREATREIHRVLCCLVE